MGGVAGLLICGLSWYGYRYYQHRKGLEELRGGLIATEKGNLETAIARLEHATRQLPEGAARQLAFVELGKAFRSQGQEAAGRQAYERALTESSEEDPLVSQLAMLELGREAERQEDLKHARHYYEQAAALEGPLKGLAALATARVLEALGENEIAGAYYEQFIETSPDSPLIEVARDKLGK